MAKLCAWNNNINKRRLHSLTRLILLVATAWPFTAHAIDIETPGVGLTSVPLEIVVSDVAAGSDVALQFAGRTHRGSAGADGRVVFDNMMTETRGTFEITATANGESMTAQLRVLPGWISVMPAFLAIAVALLLRNVIPALLLGLWLGSTALQGFSPLGALKGLMDVLVVFIVNALADPDHAAIIVFTMMIGGMVGIITRNGGMASIVRVVVSRAKTAVSGQVAVWLMGLMIFFDDYANTLVVGNTARSVTDHLKISREKLAYIVDSTAAPVVCLALVTTWIGYQVSLIDQAMQSIDGLAGMTAYSMFLHSIPYSFYPILAVVFVLAVAASGRDMGPMYRAELRARRGNVDSRSGDAMPAMDGDTLEAKPDVPMRPVNAFLPIIVLIISLAAGMFITGEGETITAIVGSADPYKAMMWASFIGALVAAGLSTGQKILTAHETVDAWYGGARATLFGMIVLLLAWSMSAVTGDLNAKGFLISILGEALPAALVPAVVFVLAAITAFATGTSWGTMGILLPLVLPLTWAVMTVSGMADPSGMHIMYSAIACVLAGAVWGDHCSPISDTTVLSSIASGCDHIEHVRTQMPYALLVGAVAIGIGTVPAGYGLPPWISLLVGGAILLAVLRFFGRNAEDSVD
ncbi:MAG: Na+/H+ antiporter NhaC family protein [Gammaproteobacteria bacterium]|nr:Na+/H+ antiporter NhaC family protein [Gammaproteobacteria bacterium]MDH3428927.1 Na+/H+ antiporter NhaC family protein [Gammaproteobacteria bacterium]